MTDVTVVDTAPRVRPNWLPIASLLICLAGLAVAVYLTIDHFSKSTTLACPNTGAINCLKVTSSSYSYVAGVPVAVAGLAYFVAMTALCLPFVWRLNMPWLSAVRLGSAVVGVVFVLYLLWAELFKVNAICLWCTGVHVLALGLYAVIAFGEALTMPDLSPPPKATGRR